MKSKMRNVNSKVLIAILGMLSVPAVAAPDVNTILVSGYLKRSSGQVVANNTYTTTVTIRDGSGNVAGCATSAGPVTVEDGYFSVPVSCTSTQLNAATGALSARVAIVIDSVTETFDVSARPVPTALVAGVANGVAAGAVTNAGISATAAIDLSKLSTTGAASGDVARYNGTAWAPATLAAASIPTTSGANSFSGTQTFTGTGTGLSVTNSATIGNGLTVSAGGATITGASTITGNLGVTGNLSSTGTTTSGGALTVSAGGAAITGASTVTGNLGVTGTLSSTGTTTSGGALTVSAGGAAITGASTVTGNLGVTGNLSSTGTTTSGGALTVSAGGAAITGNLSASGTTTSGGALTVTTGDATVSAGNLVMTAGNVTMTAGQVVLSNKTAALAATYTSAAPLTADRAVIFLTGAGASTITCISPGVAGQTLTVVYTANSVAGTDRIAAHNGACGSNHAIWTNAAANVASTTANTSAVFNFVSNGTLWYLTSVAQ